MNNMQLQPEERNTKMPTPNTLFEKKYPHMEMTDYDPKFEEITKNADECIMRDSIAMCKRVFESTVRVMMPERIENRDYYVDMAKELAEFYEIDTTVTEYEDRLVASFCVDSYNTFSGMKKIILFSDDISFQCDGERIILSIIYYTHTTYRNGKIISPCNDLHFLD